MLNLWGVCEIGEISHDPLRRWDLSCTRFSPCRPKREEDADLCCANCVNWLAFDERIASAENLEGKATSETTKQDD